MTSTMGTSDVCACHHTMGKRPVVPLMSANTMCAKERLAELDKHVHRLSSMATNTRGTAGSAVSGLQRNGRHAGVNLGVLNGRRTADPLVVAMKRTSHRHSDTQLQTVPRMLRYQTKSHPYG